MSKPMQLLPGLEIHFATDGCWLHFKGSQRECCFNLEAKLGDDVVCGRAIKEWIQGKRDAGIWYDEKGAADGG